MSNALLRLHAIASELEPDAIEALTMQAERLLMGQKQYGKLDLDKDDRDWLEQALEEQIDHNSYSTFALMKIRRAKREAGR